jgi:flavin-dependent dehydrogenase
VSFDAIVIGGGPAGSSLAALLAGRGRSVALIERAPFPRRKVCGEFISGVSFALLERLGLGEAVRSRAGPEIRRVGLLSGRRLIEAPMPAGRFGRALGREVLDTMLVEAAARAGATLFQPARAVAVGTDSLERMVTITTEAGEKRLRAPVVVAAHGSWEAGRLATNLPKQSEPHDLLGFKAHLRGGTLAPDLMPLIAFDGGYGGLVWSDDGRLSLSCCIRRDVLETLRSEDHAAAGDAVYRHMLRSCPALAAVTSEAGRSGDWLGAGPIRPGIRTVYAQDIFRAGNLAGESHPVIAEGISMALQSAWLLAEALGRQARWDEAGRSAAAQEYGHAWRRQFALRIRVASAVAAIAVSAPTRWMMRQVVSAMPSMLSAGAALSGKARPVGNLSQG